MFCTHCGTKMPEDSKFCPSCGFQTGIPSQPPMQTPETQPPAAQPVAPQKNSRHDICGVIQLVASLIAAGCYFLPYVTIGAFGISAGLSPYTLTTGINVLGYTFGGNPKAVIALLLPLAGAISVLVFPARFAQYCGFFTSVAMIYFCFGISSSVKEYSSVMAYSYGFYIALVCCGIVACTTLFADSGKKD